MMVRTPWQTFLIATYTPFVGLVLEAFVIDTDHWRHFYLLLGIIWCLAAATINFRWRQQWQAGAPLQAMASPT
jgi:predicted membrane channel-forming protein YqfA (hemolysin III family)